jgi:hypothetical protein
MAKIKTEIVIVGILLFTAFFILPSVRQGRPASIHENAAFIKLENLVMKTSTIECGRPVFYHCPFKRFSASLIVQPDACLPQSKAAKASALIPR